LKYFADMDNAKSEISETSLNLCTQLTMRENNLRKGKHGCAINPAMYLRGKERNFKNEPRTRTISDVLPPSSETGSTCATRVVNFFSSSTTPLNAVPPAHLRSKVYFKLVLPYHTNKEQRNPPQFNLLLISASAT
jgi:hypothetical protein